LKDLADPRKVVVIVAGRILRDVLNSVVAWLSETPGRMLNEIVVEGISPSDSPGRAHAR
jgi:hypothetical protein